MLVQFRYSLNLCCCFQLGVRQGNLDRVIEEFFGPHGVIKSNTPQQTFDGIKKTSTSILEKIQQRLKGSAKTKRDVMKQISAFGDKVNANDNLITVG